MSSAFRFANILLFRKLSENNLCSLVICWALKQLSSELLSVWKVMAAERSVLGLPGCKPAKAWGRNDAILLVHRSDLGDGCSTPTISTFGA